MWLDSNLCRLPIRNIHMWGYVLNFKTKIRLTTQRPVLFGLLIVPYARSALMHLCCDKKIYPLTYNIHVHRPYEGRQAILSIEWGELTAA